jgi:ribonuclease J
VSGKQVHGFSWLSLGGIGEIGKNCYVIEIQGKLLVIDVGMSFPDLHMFGVDIVIPDFTYLVKNQNKIAGIVLTHGHEDHIGSMTYLLQDLKSPPPIYGSKFTLGLLRNKLAEFNLGDTPLTEFKPGDDLMIGGISVQTIRVTHSVPDACSLAVETPAGVYVHSGDVKLDPTPVDGKLTDYEKLARIGDAGVLAMSVDTTNIERLGHSGSESSVRMPLQRYVEAHQGRVFITTFASNIHRIQQAIDIAVACRRKVLVLGRTMVDNVSMCQDLGYLKVPANVLVNPYEAESVKPEKLLVLLTGSQGEPLAAMSKLASGEHRFMNVRQEDLFLFSARPIPGNELSIFAVIDDLFRQGAEVIYGMESGTHVSGHGYQDEIREYLQLVRPQFAIPTHGYYRHQMRFKKLAQQWGLGESDVPIISTGERWHFDEGGFQKIETVKAGELYISGDGNADISRRVINERLALAQDGLLTFAVVLSEDGSEILAGPEIQGKGFLQRNEAGDLFKTLEEAIVKAIHRNRQRTPEFALQLRNNVQNVIQQIILEKTKINPVVIGMVSYIGQMTVLDNPDQDSED